MGIFIACFIGRWSKIMPIDVLSTFYCIFACYMDGIFPDFILSGMNDDCMST